MHIRTLRECPRSSVVLYVWVHVYIHLHKPPTHKVVMVAQEDGVDNDSLWSEINKPVGEQGVTGQVRGSCLYLLQALLLL